MTTNTAAWIAQLIRANQDYLITTTATLVRAAVPDYTRLPDAAVQAIFTQAYSVFARSLEADDMGPWRSYFQVALGERARAGITPAGVIATVGIVQEQVQALAERHLPPDPGQAAEVRSILRSFANRVRLLISELNLAQLSGRPPAADSL